MRNAKIKGNFGVIYNKEKLVVTNNGSGDIIVAEYGNGRIVIVGNAAWNSLGKSPEAALALKSILILRKGKK